MRIDVAADAAQILPVINGGRFWLELGGFLVTVGAWNGHVAAREHELCFLVFREAECGRLVSLEVVATIARIEIRRGCELSSVAVAVAICAAIELHLEQRVLSFGDMALGAVDGRVLALKWVCTRGMFLHCEERRLPSLHGVT